MNKTAAAIGFFLVWSLVAYAGARIPTVDLSAAKSLPRLPILIRGCEGECCGILKTKMARFEFQLYETPDRSSKKVSLIKKGEAFESAEFFTKMLKFGEVREGQKKLTVLTYLSEGSSIVWDGKEIRATESDEDYRSPETESWVQIKTKTGVEGWANLPSKDGKELDYGGCG
jgi:hypothetical protein